MKKLVFSLLFVTVLAACASQEAKEQPGAAVEEKNPTAQQAQPGAQTQPAQAKPVEENPLTNPASILSKRDIYFDFDSYVVKDEYRPLVEAHAKYLQAHPNAQVTLQGNADERGSREYNLALGQRRADSVKKMMELLGVPSKQIDTVSFGKEKPVCTEHNEACWAKNRHVHIVYKGE